MYYTALYFTALYYTALYYTALYYTALYYNALYYTALYYTALYYNALRYPLEELLSLRVVLEGEERHRAPHRLILGVDLLDLPLGLLVLVEAVLVQAPGVGYHATTVQLSGPLLPPQNGFSTLVAPSNVRLC